MSETLRELATRFRAGAAVAAAIAGKPYTALDGAEREYCEERERQSRQSGLSGHGGIRVPIAAVNRALTNDAASGGALIQNQSPLSADDFYFFFERNPLIGMGINVLEPRSFGAPVRMPFTAVTANFINIDGVGAVSDAAVEVSGPVTKQRTVAARVPLTRVFRRGDAMLSSAVMMLVRRALVLRSFEVMLEGDGVHEPRGIRLGNTVSGGPTTPNMGAMLSEDVHSRINQLSPGNLGYVLPRAGNIADSLNAVSAGMRSFKSIYLGAQACILRGFGMVYGDWSATALVPYSPDIEFRIKDLAGEHVLRAFMDWDFVYHEDAFAASEDTA